MRGDTWTGLLTLAATMLAAAPPTVSAQRPTVATWTLAPAPTWSIGGANDTTEMSRMAWVLRVPTAGIVLYDLDARALRLYSPGGVLLTTFGHAGRGPGELQTPTWMGVWRDTLFVVDGVTLRLSHFSSRGQYLSGRPLPVELVSRYHVAGRLANGMWVLRSRGSTMDKHGQHGVIRDDEEVVLAPELRLPTAPAVARTKGPAFHYRSRGQGAGASVTVSMAAFAALGFVQVGPRTIWVGDGATDSLVAWSQAGQRLAAVRVPWPERKVTADLARQEKARWRARSLDANWQLALDELFAPANVPSVLPRFGAAFLGEDERLWVGSYAADPGDAVEYAVFDARGRPLARLTPPPRLRLIAAGGDWVLGIHTDDDGVQSLRRYGLRTS